MQITQLLIMQITQLFIMQIIQLLTSEASELFAHYFLFCYPQTLKWEQLD